MAMRLDHGADDLNEVHDINVTPFIDVMLVLLIIFMVAASSAAVRRSRATGLSPMARLRSDFRVR